MLNILEPWKKARLTKESKATHFLNGSDASLKWVAGKNCSKASTIMTPNASNWETGRGVGGGSATGSEALEGSFGSGGDSKMLRRVADLEVMEDEDIDFDFTSTPLVFSLSVSMQYLHGVVSLKADIIILLAGVFRAVRSIFFLNHGLNLFQNSLKSYCIKVVRCVVICALM